MVRGVKNGKCRTCVHASATAATVCNTHHCLCCAGASVVRSLPSCPRKIFRGIQDLAGLPARPHPGNPSHEPLSAHSGYRCCRDVVQDTRQRDCPGFAPGSLFNSVRCCHQIRRKIIYLRRHGKNKLQKFFRYSRRNFSSRFSRSTRRSRSSQTNAKNEGVSRHWLTPSLEYYK